ncbi:hypothetical protein IB279_13795 [Ensifer sp. ENS06]|uniref:hypothetical protein n=1 Tax=Ensifer sp. ENS06 TaxID=2769276 RepID=UPI0017823F13|nr:hypothetical protein [Ensifer sp. ENS06]MBD9624016.1 hypothetical protein [Ensifer sp. ENS06]
MILETLMKFLGEEVSLLLQSSPFKGWSFERTVDEDLPERSVNYVSARNGFSIVCDSRERVSSIFLESGNTQLNVEDLPFSADRDYVLRLLGNPSKTGAPHKDSILGDFGAWDRFDGATCSLHIEYHVKKDGIRRITLMRPEVAP